MASGYLFGGPRQETTTWEDTWVLMFSSSSANICATLIPTGLLVAETLFTFLLTKEIMK